MSRHCTHLAEQAARLATAQREFWHAWKGVQADGRAGLPEARRAHVALEEAFVLARRALYQAWFPRELPSVVTKRDYTLAKELNEARTASYRHISMNADGSFYTLNLRISYPISIHRWNAQISRELPDDLASMIGITIATIATTPDGRVIVVSEDKTSSRKGDFIVHRATRNADGSYVREELFRHDDPFYHIQPLWDGRFLTGDIMGNLHVWSCRDRRWERVLIGRHDDAEITCMQMMEDERIISGGTDGEVVLWSPREEGSGYDKKVVGSHDGFVTCLQGMRDGSIVSGGDDGIVALATPMENGLYRHALLDSRSEVTCLQYLPNHRVIVGLENGTIIQLGTVNGDLTPMRGIGVHEQVVGRNSVGRSLVERRRVMDLLVQEDGRIISAGDGGIRMWDGVPVQDTEDVEQSAPL